MLWSNPRTDQLTPGRPETWAGGGRRRPGKASRGAAEASGRSASDSEPATGRRFYGLGANICRRSDMKTGAEWLPGHGAGVIGRVGGPARCGARGACGPSPLLARINSSG